MEARDWHEYSLSKDLQVAIKQETSKALGWKVAVIYGPTSLEDMRYMSEKPKNDWSIYEVMEGLRSIGVNAEWLDPTDEFFINNIRNYDAAFINAHGEYGEDGNLQGLLAYIGMPYTNSGVATSAISADKRITKMLMRDCGLMTPSSQRIHNDINLSEIEMEKPSMLKAINGGSSIGIAHVTNRLELEKARFQMQHLGFREFILESFIDGISVTVPMIKIGKDIIILPPIECIVEGVYYDDLSKLSGTKDGIVKYNCITNINSDKFKCLNHEMKKIAKNLEFEGAIRADFIISRNGEVQLLELNTNPGVQRGSNLMLSANEIGIKYEDILGLILLSAKNMHKLTPWTRVKANARLCMHSN